MYLNIPDLLSLLDADRDAFKSPVQTLTVLESIILDLYGAGCGPGHRQQTAFNDPRCLKTNISHFRSDCRKSHLFKVIAVVAAAETFFQFCFVFHKFSYL